jgi:hypothetical protein
MFESLARDEGWRMELCVCLILLKPETYSL